MKSVEMFWRWRLAIALFEGAFEHFLRVAVGERNKRLQSLRRLSDGFGRCGDPRIDEADWKTFDEAIDLGAKAGGQAFAREPNVEKGPPFKRHMRIEIEASQSIGKFIEAQRALVGQPEKGDWTRQGDVFGSDIGAIEGDQSDAVPIRLFGRRQRK